MIYALLGVIVAFLWYACSTLRIIARNQIHQTTRLEKGLKDLSHAVKYPTKR